MTDQSGTWKDDGRAWKDRLPFLTPNFISHTVQGQTYHFYPLSTRTIFKLKAVAKPIAAALTAVFQKTDYDFDYVERQVQSDVQKGLTDREIVRQAISPEIAKLRHTQRTEAVSNLIDALTDDDNRVIVGEIIMDSMKDDFPRGQRSRVDVEQFLDEVPLPALTDLLVGAVKANKGLLGPLASKLDGMEDAIKSRIEEGLKRPGTSSPTASSGSSGTDSPTSSYSTSTSPPSSRPFAGQPG